MISVVFSLPGQSHSPGEATRPGGARDPLRPEDSQDDEGHQRDELHDREGGLDCVGASALRAGTFWNDWTIKTKTFR